jgi:endonuclease/exonuclease/phosphatase family metal-dependent hydrolase
MPKFFKSLILLITCLCSLSTAFAADESLTFGYTYILVTNNTNESIDINPVINTDDADFKNSTHWQGSATTLSPYETKEVLRFDRDAGLHTSNRYHFTVQVSNTLFPAQDLQFDFDVKAKTVFGSDIKAFMTLPGSTNQAILTANGLEHYKTNFWSPSYTLSARSWLKTAHINNNYHFVINKNIASVSDTPSNHTISVLTYNTQLMPFYAGTVDKLNQPGIRAKDIPAKIANNDVVVLEELFDHDLRESISSEMRKYYSHYTTVVGEGTSRALTGGVMIFSKWPIVREKQIVYNASSGLDSLSAKGAMYVAINKNGKIYHVFGTHLQAADDDDSVKARRKQLSELANFVDLMNIPAEEPVLLAGDFNIDEFSNEAQNLYAILNASAPANIGFRYSVDNFTNSMNVGKERKRLDYILYRNTNSKPILAVNNVYVLRDLNNEVMWPEFDLSDHYPTDSYFAF